MSAVAAASSRRASRNQRITRRRTRSVSVAKSAAVTGRAGDWLQPAASPSRRRQEGRRCVTPCIASSRHEDAVGDAGVEMHVVVLGHRDHPLPHGHRRDDVIGEVGGRLGHVATIAGRADATALAAGRRQGGPSMAPSCRAADGNAKGPMAAEPGSAGLPRRIPCGTSCRPRGRSRSRGARTGNSRGVRPRRIPARAARRLPARRASSRGSPTRSCGAASSRGDAARSGGTARGRHGDGVGFARETL